MDDQTTTTSTPVPAAEAHDLFERIRASEQLPSVPQVAWIILSLSRDANVDLDKLASIINADPALVAKLLRLANSSLFSPQTPITAIRKALVRLGLKVTRMAVLGFGLADELRGKVPPLFDLNYFWHHALTTAAAARTMCETVGSRRAEEAFAAGLMQDLGVLVLHCVAPDAYAAVLAEQRASPTVELHRIEERLLGLTHMEAGAELLERWGLPAEICRLVRSHHRPEAAEDGGADPASLETLRILHLGAWIARFFCDPAKGVTHHRIARLAERDFSLTAEMTAAMLQKANERVRDLIGLFDADPALFPSYLELQAQATAELSRLAIKTEIDREQGERDQRSSDARAAELEKRCRILKDQATIDGLTGLLNRSEILERLELELARTRRYGDSVGLLMIDIDHFKQINDTYGHPVGDRFLEKLGQYLKQTLRRNDLAGRYGGEEFVVVEPTTDQDGVVMSAERLRLGIREASRRWVEFCADGISVSIGAIYASATSPSLESASLLAAVDRCLYAAKEAGRNCTRYATM